MTKKPENKVPNKIFRTSRIIAHWREYYRHKEPYDSIWKLEEIDEYLNSVAKHIGRPMTEDEESDILDIIDEFTPKGIDDKYLGHFPSGDKMWEVYELRKQNKKNKI